MKKEVILAGIIMGFFIMLSAFAHAAAEDITTTAVNSTYTEAAIESPQNLYGYDVTYEYTGEISGVVSNGLLSSDGGSVTDIGYSTRGNKVSIYESRLDNTQTGITASGVKSLFNITHSGTLTLSAVTLVYANGAEKEVDYNDDGTTIVTITTTTGGGGGGVTVQHYSIKILSPGDVTLPQEGTINVPITIQNPGSVSLVGIKLSANVTFNNLISEDVKITLEQEEIAEIKAGGSREMLVTINANTKKQGIYKITIYADVTSPKFSDWGEFYIEFKKTTESDADNAIAAAEKLISENQECVELTEVVNEAKFLLENRDFTKSAARTQEAIDACEKAIVLSKKKSAGIRLDNQIIYYSIIATAAALLIILIFYVYRKMKYRKSKKRYS